MQGGHIHTHLCNQADGCPLSLSLSLSPCPLLSHLEHEETRLHDARLEEKGPELLVAEVVKDEPRGPVVVGRRGAHQRAHRSATASPLAASSMTASTRRLLTKRLPIGLIDIMIALRNVVVETHRLSIHICVFGLPRVPQTSANVNAWFPC